MIYVFMIEFQYYIFLDNDEEFIEKCQEWGLFLGKVIKFKMFYYKGNGLNIFCIIIGYVDYMVVVI